MGRPLKVAGKKEDITGRTSAAALRSPWEFAALVRRERENGQRACFPTDGIVCR